MGLHGKVTISNGAVVIQAHFYNYHLPGLSASVVSELIVWVGKRVASYWVCLPKYQQKNSRQCGGTM